MRSVYEPVRRFARLERAPDRVRPAWRRLAGRLLLGALVTSLAVLGVCGWYLRADLAYDPDNLIRLHVVANSDAPADQALKLEVRDAILSTSGELFAVSAPEDAAALVKANLPLFERVAREVLRAGGYEYPVAVEFGRYWFPERSYGPLLLPAGEYQALRVVIGEGRGANWWCILFPPLCYLDATSGVRSQNWTLGVDGSIVTAPTVAGPELRPGVGSAGSGSPVGQARVLSLETLTDDQVEELEDILDRALKSLASRRHESTAPSSSSRSPTGKPSGPGEESGVGVIIADVPGRPSSDLVILVADTGEDRLEVRFFIVDRLRDLFRSLARQAPWLFALLAPETPDVKLTDRE